MPRTDTAAERPPVEASSASEDNAGDDRSRPTRVQHPPANGGRSFLEGLFERLRPRMPRLVREDLTKALLTQGPGADAFSPAERAMLNNILRLREVRVEDIMVPRADIRAMEITTTLGELMKQFEASGHSRMPVYGESLDDPRGMVHIRDVVGHITRVARPAKQQNGSAAPAKKPRAGLDLRQINLARKVEDIGIIRKVLFVPPSMLATDLMARMQAARIQMALVIDEYGGTDGLVSLEDVIEMVVGNIEDEHDDEAPMITERGDGIFYADARADLDEVKKVIGEDFDISEYEEEADTIGGLLFSELGRVPARGEVVQAVPGFEFQVLEADPRRVRRVRIIRFRQGEKRRRIVEGLADQA